MTALATDYRTDVFADIWSAWEPRDPQPICDWVEQNIYFSSKVSSVTGYWSHAAFPYSPGVLEAMADPSIAEVILMWGTQLAKTTNGGGYVAWIASEDPKPVLIACPDEKSAEEHQKTKLIPMLESIECIRHKILPPRQRKKTLINLGDQVIYYSWSGAKWSVSGRSAAVVFITEVNLHSRGKTTEGDPVEMARDRTKGFSNYKIIVEGKPGEQGSCRLEKLYLESDQRLFYLPCPLCGHYQPLEFGGKDHPTGLKWQTNEHGELIEESVHYQCIQCQGNIDTHHKAGMLSHGVWVAKGQRVENGRAVGIPDKRNRIAGFKLSSLYSIIIPWPDLVRKWLVNKRESVEATKNFVQGWLAETWKIRGRKANYEELLEHKGTYNLGTVPEPAIALIGTVDVQQSGLWYVIRAWGYGGSSWLIRYGYLLSFDELKALLSDSYKGADGAHYRLQDCWIDSGYRTTEVYEFCAKTGCKPIKGTRQYRQPGIISPLKVPEFGLQGWNIDKGQACDQFYDRRLHIKRGDPGFWEFAADVGGDYVRSILTWERHEEKDKFGRIKMDWRSVSKEYEHLADAEIYGEAAAAFYQFALKDRPATANVQRIPEVKRRDGRSWWQR